MMVAVLLWSNPKFNRLPHYKMIAVGTCSLSFLLAITACKVYHLFEWPYKLLNLSMPQHLYELAEGESIQDIQTYRNLYISVTLTSIINRVLWACSEDGALYINSVLLIDNYLTLRNPFQSYESRFTFYKIIGFLLEVCIIVVMTNNTVSQTNLVSNSSLILYYEWFTILLVVPTFVAFVLFIVKINK